MLAMAPWISTPLSVPQIEKAPKIRIEQHAPATAESPVQHLPVGLGPREQVGDDDDHRHALDEVDDELELKALQAHGCSWRSAARMVASSTRVASSSTWMAS